MTTLLTWLADGVVYRVLGLMPGTHLADALHFFIYDTIKILFMLAVIISLIRSFFPPEKTRALLSRRHQYVGNILAAFLGIVTPFCSCSAVPVFIGMVELGPPRRAVANYEARQVDGVTVYLAREAAALSGQVEVTLSRGLWSTGLFIKSIATSQNGGR